MRPAGTSPWRLSRCRPPLNWDAAVWLPRARGLRRPPILLCGRAGGILVSGWGRTWILGLGRKDTVDRSPMQRPRQLLCPDFLKEILPPVSPAPFQNLISFKHLFVHKLPLGFGHL